MKRKKYSLPAIYGIVYAMDKVYAIKYPTVARVFCDHDGRKTHGLVYLINIAGTDYVKIGMSSSARKKRLRSLSTGLPFRLNVLAVIFTRSPVAFEKVLHRRTSQYHCINEWFCIPPETLNGVFNIISELVAIASREEDSSAWMSRRLGKVLCDGRIFDWCSSGFRGIEILSIETRGQSKMDQKEKRKRFIECRKALGMTQPQIAVALGYKVKEKFRASYVSSKERGHRAVTDKDIFDLEELVLESDRDQGV